MRLYNIQGKKYPSVTSVLKVFYDDIYPHSSSKMADYMNDRAKVGTITHKLIEKSLKGHPLAETDKEGEPYEYYKQAWPVVKNLNVAYCEKIVHSHDLRVAGCLDMLVNGKNNWEVWDLKTSKYHKFGIKLDGYKMQVSVYAHCVNTHIIPLLFGNKEQRPNVNRCALLMAYQTNSEVIFLEQDEMFSYLELFRKYRAKFDETYGLSE